MAERQSHPLRGFLDMMSEMERMRHLGKTGADPTPETGARTHATAWWPTTDVIGRDSDMVISAEIPGVAPGDIDISVSEGVLTISGVRHGEPNGTDVAYVRERYFGHFRRSLVLPEGVDQGRIEARFDHGVVQITVPDAVDAAAPTPHRIRITGGDPA